MRGQRNRIEDNQCTAGDRGIEVTSIFNTVVRNVCQANPVNWFIESGNFVAPIVLATVSNADIAGNVYTGNLGSTDPNANFTE